MKRLEILRFSYCLLFWIAGTLFLLALKLFFEDGSGHSGLSLMALPVFMAAILMASLGFLLRFCKRLTWLIH